MGTKLQIESDLVSYAILLHNSGTLQPIEYYAYGESLETKSYWYLRYLHYDKRKHLIHFTYPWYSGSLGIYIKYWAWARAISYFVYHSYFVYFV